MYKRPTATATAIVKCCVCEKSYEKENRKQNDK